MFNVVSVLLLAIVFCPMESGCRKSNRLRIRCAGLRGFEHSAMNILKELFIPTERN